MSLLQKCAAGRVVVLASCAILKLHAQVSGSNAVGGYREDEGFWVGVGVGGLGVEKGREQQQIYLIQGRLAPSLMA